MSDDQDAADGFSRFIRENPAARIVVSQDVWDAVSARVSQRGCHQDMIRTVGVIVDSRLPVGTVVAIGDRKSLFSAMIFSP